MSRCVKVLVLALAVLCIRPPATHAQTAPRAFSVFIDCPDTHCDGDFYRTELAFVDHVRDRTAADVHILVTSERTGGGGEKFTLAFYGQRRFAGISDTLTVNTPQGNTEDEQRKTLARTMRSGLVRFLARTPDGSRIVVTLEDATASTTKATPAHDPWNAWVFRIGANLNGDKETRQQSRNINGNLRASRITEQWKTTLRVDEYYNDYKVTIGGEEITNIRRDYGGGALQVRSLNDHWSLGARAGASSSTYLNQRLGINVAPAIEYDHYPYKESTRRQLIAQYSAGMRYFSYNDTTIYFKTKETRPFESLSLGYSQKQTWGSIDAGVNGYHFLDDLSKSRLNMSLEADVRLFKGLNLSSYIDYAVIHDQIFLAKGDATRDEVLLRQSQLQTGYRAFFYISLNYTFGSVLNNVVNPRFNASRNDF